ncbi:helix-turn-helix domain-containing protein [Glacieibacterium frigidum]|uniref:Helix-turn-helix transcriptional regulator n=1 Tax=Glacieibacterium frigidum TaxID=2593303 RepID=A0A552UH51_9SPHN|nr:AraC family transcriptional regulator [Glacieibacterium frigidum]TRW17540.1 helix-turn-helix transcriptional regulator [Glacieibacterium frigidum]
MLDSARPGPAFHASVGHAAFDAIRFSEKPVAQLVARPSQPLAIVRHVGSAHDGIVSAATEPNGFDTLVLNVTSGGRYRGRVGGARVDLPLQRGQMSFVPGTQDFDIDYPASNGVVLLMLPQTLGAQLGAAMGTGVPSPMFSERHDRLAQLFLMTERELVMPGFASDLMIDGLLRAMFTILARREGGGPPPPSRVHLPPAKLKRVTDFIEAELGRGISLDDIAGVAGLSPFHFSRVFKMATGETPYRFLGARRLARARALLAGAMPLAEIALACGFASQSHFTAAFTKAFGLSPGRYRRQLAD